MRTRIKYIAAVGSIVIVVMAISVLLVVMNDDAGRRRFLLDLNGGTQIDVRESSVLGIMPVISITSISIYMPERLDAAVDCILECEELERVWIVDAPVSDAIVCRILKLPLLKECRVVGEWEQISLGSDGLSCFPATSSIEDVDFSGSSVNDDAIALMLRRAPNLKILSLQETKIDGSGFSEVHDCNLEVLDISDTAVDDQDIVQLAQCPRLVNLDVSGTRVSDICVEAISNCKNLKVIDLGRTFVTEQGIKRLRENRPSLRVEWVADHVPVEPSISGKTSD